MELTAIDGTYAVHGLPAGDYAVTIDKAGYVATTLYLTVIAGQTTVGDTALTPASTAGAGSMAGAVYADSRTADSVSRPLAGALVRLVPADFPNSDAPLPVTSGAGSREMPPLALPEYYAFSGEDGTYRIDGVPAGSYLAVAVRHGFMPDKRSVNHRKRRQPDAELHPDTAPGRRRHHQGHGH